MTELVIMINKIAHIQPYCLNTEFVIIVVPVTELPFPPNRDPNVNSTCATPQTACPSHAPYLGHLPRGSNIIAIQWYKMEWNEFLLLRCGANIYFNDILQVLT